MSILAISVTEQGRSLASRLPYEHVHGNAGDTIRTRWDDVDGFVLFLATGAAVRIVAPLLGDKRTDPAVVCVDETGRYAVALCGGHAGGANELARSVAAALGGEAVITTATDSAGTVALDDLPGFVATGDVASVTTALLDGRPVEVENPLEWPLPDEMAPSRDAGARHRIVVTDLDRVAAEDEVVLHPPSLVAGIGASRGAPAEEIDRLLDAALAGAGLARASVAEVATIDVKADEGGILSLGFPIRTFSSSELGAVAVPTPSQVVAAEVGTPSVAEAAALLAAGEGGSLVVPKQKSAMATVAIARRARPRGHLSLVGLGPGRSELRTPAAERAVRHADVVIGYGPYVDQGADLLSARQEIVRSPIGDEVVRAKQSLAEAAAGRRVALVCSGDAGVYAMASVTLELAEGFDIDVEVVPGVTAALAAAAALGAPLGHDHVNISLSDLLTPWEAIERRLAAAAAGDLVVCLYNPRSRGRDWQLDAARRILLTGRPATTPVGIVTDAARPGETVTMTTLGELDVEQVGMTTCVIIGSSTTRLVAGRMVTPRGYDA